MQAQLNQMLRWAAELAPTPNDSDESWDLLSAMVTGRKEVMRDVAGESSLSHYVIPGARGR